MFLKSFKLSLGIFKLWLRLQLRKFFKHFPIMYLLRFFWDTDFGTQQHFQNILECIKAESQLLGKIFE